MLGWFLSRRGLADHVEEDEEEEEEEEKEMEGRRRMFLGNCTRFRAGSGFTLLCQCCLHLSS